MKSKIVALSKNEEFKNLLKQKKITNKYVSIFFGKLLNKDKKRLNISFVTKKKIGNAVKRNKIKRRVKEIFRNNHLSIDGGSFVFIAHKPLVELSFKEASVEIVNAVKSSIHNWVKK